MSARPTSTHNAPTPPAWAAKSPCGHSHCKNSSTRTTPTAEQDQEWRAKYALRADVEGTIRQAIAVTGSRRACYRVLAKTHLEHVYCAVALNLIRLDAWLNGQPLNHTRTSHLTRTDLALGA